MNRNTRTLIVLAVAIVMASLASFGVYLAISSIPERRVEIAQVHTVVDIHGVAPTAVDQRQHWTQHDEVVRIRHLYGHCRDVCRAFGNRNAGSIAAAVRRDDRIEVSEKILWATG